MVGMRMAVVVRRKGEGEEEAETGSVRTRDM